jgi:hypothetical protein
MLCLFTGILHYTLWKESLVLLFHCHYALLSSNGLILLSEVEVEVTLRLTDTLELVTDTTSCRSAAV